MSEALSIPENKSGELTKLEEKSAQVIDFYKGASQKSVTKSQQDILLAPTDPNDVEIKPEGSPYLPQIKYRRKLNEAFGPMGWAMIPMNELTTKGNILYRKYGLYVNERFVSEAIGSQQYFEANANMDYADAAEGVKSNAIERCCKELGVASELWDPVWIRKWKADYAIEVKAPIKGQMKEVWRRKDQPPFKGEGGTISSAQTITPPPQQQPQTQQPSDPEIISDPQRKRMYAMARNAGYTDLQFKELLVACGYQTSSDVRKKHYQTICESIESTPLEQLPIMTQTLAKWCKEN